MPSSTGSSSFVARQWGQIRRAPVACSLALVVVCIQLLVELQGGWVNCQWWYEQLGLSRVGVGSGKVWQLLSYAFLHGGGWHVGINAMLVLGIGSRVEAILGSGVLLRVVAVGVLIGGGLHLLVSESVLVGISAACFTLMLLLTTLSPESRMFPMPLSAKSLGWGIVIAEVLFVIIDPDLGIVGLELIGKALNSMGLGVVFDVSHACHIGGAVWGWVYGRWILRNRVTLQSLQRQRAKRES